MTGTSHDATTLHVINEHLLDARHLCRTGELGSQGPVFKALHKGYGIIISYGGHCDTPSRSPFRDLPHITQLSASSLSRSTLLAESSLARMHLPGAAYTQ